MKADTYLQSGDYSTSFNKFVFNEIPEETYCLDVGCWNGNLGKYLIKDKNCKVDGIDSNEKILKIAKKVGYTNTFNINLNSEALNFKSIKQKYDVIIFADVLEHLINPELVLKELQKCLKPDGKIIISLPNVAFLLNRILLLLGKWDYREFGTLDKTHLKFYTLKTAPKMIESTGLKVVKKLPYNQFSFLPYLEPLNKLFPEVISYQFLFVAKKK